MPKRSGRELDFQLDLTPFISLLSVCICFLLLTVAWFQIGALTVKQALGGQPAAQQKEKSSLWVYIEPARAAPAAEAKKPSSPSPPSAEQAGQADQIQTVRIKVKRGAKRLAEEAAVTFRRGDRDKLKKRIQAVRLSWPDLDQAFILPEKDVLYEEIIKVIDTARQAGVLNIGISPI